MDQCHEVAVICYPKLQGLKQSLKALFSKKQKLRSKGLCCLLPENQNLSMFSNELFSVIRLTNREIYLR